jgi:hypothetical protein
MTHVILTAVGQVLLRLGIDFRLGSLQFRLQIDAAHLATGLVPPHGLEETAKSVNNSRTVNVMRAIVPFWSTID